MPPTGFRTRAADLGSLLDSHLCTRQKHTRVPPTVSSKMLRANQEDRPEFTEDGNCFPKTETYPLVPRNTPTQQSAL